MMKSGDVLSLYEEHRQSYVCGDILAGVTLLPGKPAFPSVNFRDTLFRITKYVSSAPRGNADGASAATLTYGDQVQLEHVLSSYFLSITMETGGVAKSSTKNGLKASLSAESSEETVFVLSSGSRMLSVCEPVHGSDLITLMAPKWMQSLSIVDHLDTGGSDTGGAVANSVVANKMATRFEAVPFANRTDPDTHICGGLVIRLRHRELDATMMVTPPETRVRLRHAGPNLALRGNSSRSLFAVSLMKAEHGGGKVGWGQPFCLIHFSTRRFLAVDLASSKGGLVTVAEPDPETTWFAFQPSSRPGPLHKRYVMQADAFYVSHMRIDAATVQLNAAPAGSPAPDVEVNAPGPLAMNPVGTASVAGWVHAESYFLDGDELAAANSTMVDNFSDLGNCEVSVDKYCVDTFSVSVMSEMMQQDLRTTIGVTRSLDEHFCALFSSQLFRDKVAAGKQFDTRYLAEDIAHLVSGLRVLVQRCTLADSHGKSGHESMSMEQVMNLDGTPDVSWQNLLLETQCLAACVRMLKALTLRQQGVVLSAGEGQGGAVRLSKVAQLFPANRGVTLVRLTTRLLRQASKNNPVAKVVLGEDISSFFLHQMGQELDIGVVSLVECVLTDNEQRLSGSLRMNKDDFDSVVSSVAQMQRPERGFRLLSGLCVCNGQTLSNNQSLISRAVFISEHCSALVHKASDILDLDRLKAISCSNEYCDVKGSQVLAHFDRHFVRGFINMLATLCTGRDPRNASIQIIENWLGRSKERIFVVLACASLHSDLRAAFTRLACEIFVNVMPQMPIQQIILTRQWDFPMLRRRKLSRNLSVEKLLVLNLMFFDRCDSSDFFKSDTASTLDVLIQMIRFGLFDDDRMVQLQKTILKLASSKDVVIPISTSAAFVPFKDVLMRTHVLATLISTNRTNFHLTAAIRFYEKSLVDLFDANRDGQFDFDQNAMLSKKEAICLRGQFDVFDTDSEGDLDRQEFRAVMLKRMTGDFVDEDALQFFFEQVDTNNDGKIDFNEYAEWASRPETSSVYRIPNLMAVFERWNDTVHTSAKCAQFVLSVQHQFENFALVAQLATPKPLDSTVESLTSLVSDVAFRMMDCNDDDLRRSSFDLIFLQYTQWKELQDALSGTYLVTKLGDEHGGECVDLLTLVEKVTIIFDAVTFRTTRSEGDDEHKQRADALTIATLDDLANQCYTSSESGERGPHTRNQKIFQVRGVYEVVIGLLDWEVSDFTEHEAGGSVVVEGVADLKVEEACCKFLIAFMFQNAENKQMLFAKAHFMDLVNLSGKVTMVAQVLVATVKNDFRLCTMVSKRMLTQYALGIVDNVPDESVLDFFKAILCAKDEVVEKNRELVLHTFLEHQRLLDPFTPAYMEDLWGGDEIGEEALKYEQYQIGALDILTEVMRGSPLSRIEGQLLVSLDRIKRLCAIVSNEFLKLRAALIRYMTVVYLTSRHDKPWALMSTLENCCLTPKDEKMTLKHFLVVSTAIQSMYESQMAWFRSGYSTDGVQESIALLKYVTAAYFESEFAPSDPSDHSQCDVKTPEEDQVLFASCILSFDAICRGVGRKLLLQAGAVDPEEIRLDIGSRNVTYFVKELMDDIINQEGVTEDVKAVCKTVRKLTRQEGLYKIRRKVGAQRLSRPNWYEATQVAPAIPNEEFWRLSAVESGLQSNLSSLGEGFDECKNKGRHNLLGMLQQFTGDKSLEVQSQKMLQSLIKVMTAAGHGGTPTGFFTECLQLLLELFAKETSEEEEETFADQIEDMFDSEDHEARRRKTEERKAVLVNFACSFGLPKVLSELIAFESPLINSAMELSSSCLRFGKIPQTAFFTALSEPALQTSFFDSVETMLIRYEPPTVFKLMKEQFEDDQIENTTTSLTAQMAHLLTLLSQFVQGHYKDMQSLMSFQPATSVTANIVVDVNTMLQRCCVGLKKLFDTHNEAEDDEDVLRAAVDEVVYVMEVGVKALQDFVLGPHFGNLDHAIASGFVTTFNMTLKTMGVVRTRFEPKGTKDDQTAAPSKMTRRNSRCDSRMPDRSKSSRPRTPSGRGKSSRIQPEGVPLENVSTFSKFFHHAQAVRWEPIGEMGADPLACETDLVKMLAAVARGRGAVQYETIMLQLDFELLEARLSEVFLAFRSDLPGIDIQAGLPDNNLCTQYIMALFNLRDAVPSTHRYAILPLFKLPRAEKIIRIIHCVEVARNGGLQNCYFVLSEEVRHFWRNKRVQQHKDELLMQVNRTDRQAKIEGWWSMGEDLKCQMKQMRMTSSIWLRLDVFFEEWTLILAIIINFMMVWLTIAPPLESYAVPNNVTFPGQYPETSTTSTWDPGLSKSYKATILTALCILQAFCAPFQFWCYVVVQAPLLMDKARRDAVRKQKMAEEDEDHDESEYVAPHPHSLHDSKKCCDKFRYLAWALRIVFYDNTMPTYYLIYLGCCLAGVFYNHFFFAFCLTEVIFQVSTMKVVVKSVMRASLTILMWLTLLIFVVYWTSLISFGVFRYSFNNPSKGCQTLWQCTVTNFDGIRNGGGVGSLMSGLQWDVARFDDNAVMVPTLELVEYARLICSFMYFMVVSRLFVAVLNGIVVSAFAEMRRIENVARADLESRCFICQIDNEAFNKRRDKGFISHYKSEHNMYDYIFLSLNLDGRDPSTYTGQDSYIATAIANDRIEEILPFKAAMSLMDPSNAILNPDDGKTAATEVAAGDSDDAAASAG